MLTKNDFLVLHILNKNQYTSMINSITLQKLESESTLSYNQVRYSIEKLLDEKYIRQGHKQVNSLTYYITKTGIETIKGVFDVE